MSNPDRRARRQRQQGLTLIELLVGLFLGLLVIAAALGTLAVSRSVAGTVSELTQLQQQGAYALHAIGIQLRQAGSLSLTEVPGMPGVFAFDDSYRGLDDEGVHVSGTDGAGNAPDTLTASSQPAAPASQRRDCLGQAVSGDRVRNSFRIGDGQLRCLGSGSPVANALTDNAANFQVHYRVMTQDGTQRLTATQVGSADLWSSVKAVEVCLHLEGNTSGDAAASGSYEDCHGVERSRNGRLHIVLRNVFDLRTRGI